MRDLWMEQKTHLSIIANIKKILNTNNISIKGLERKSGLRYGAIQNILNGRSKNPTIKVLKSIAAELGCTINDLVYNNQSSPISPQVERVGQKLALGSDIWDDDLFIKTSMLVKNILNLKKVKTTNEQAILCIVEVYNFSSKNQNKSPDQRFAEWIIENFLVKKKNFRAT
jgi:transcriptional regulator with XRE-family HTH domain